MAYTVIVNSRIAPDAPDSTTLWHDIRDNSDWILSAISDGATASQGIDTTSVNTSGDVTAGEDIILAGNVQKLAGTLNFDIPQSSFNGAVSFDLAPSIVGIDLEYFQALMYSRGF